MQDSTINYLIHLLKKDGLIFKKDFSTENLTKEIMEKLKKKIIKQYKAYRWILAITLSLIFASFLYLDIISPNFSKFAQEIIRFWFIFIPIISINIFVSKYAWHGKRNLLILELLEKEALSKNFN
jgi:hypothetical protein